MTVEGFGRLMQQALKVFGKRLLFFVDGIVLLSQLITRVREQKATITINNQVFAIKLSVRQVYGTHYGRDSHSTRKNSHVRVGRAFHRHHGAQLFSRHFTQHGRRQFFADQNSIIGVIVRTRGLFVTL